MNGSRASKTSRVLMYLCFNPQKLYFYIKYCLLSNSSPLQLELPWFSLTSIEFLKKWLSNKMFVFEYGSGGSTLFFSKLCKEVISVENNINWFYKLKNIINDRRILNIKLHHFDYDFYNANNFTSSEYLNSIPDLMFDVIVVDGAEESRQVRPICFYHAETKIKNGGIIILDDSWRYTQIKLNNKAKSFRTFKSIGPCRTGVTSTDIYFY